MTHNLSIQTTPPRAVLADRRKDAEPQLPARRDPLLRALLLRVVPVLALGLLGRLAI